MHRPRSARHPARVVALCALLCACSGSAPPQLRAEHPGFRDARFEEHDEAVFAPRPGTSARAGDGVALAATGGEEQARSAAVSMVQALLDGDAPALGDLFAERVLLVLTGNTQARAELIERCVREARALQYEPDARVDAIVELSAIEVRRAGLAGDATLPPAIRASDLLVTLPAPRGANAETLHHIPCLTALYVRPGTRSTIVGITR